LVDIAIQRLAVQQPVDLVQFQTFAVIHLIGELDDGHGVLDEHRAIQHKEEQCHGTKEKCGSVRQLRARPRTTVRQ
jgi:hypothetical protein